MNKEKTMDVLNALIKINNDRIEGYESASKETTETDLKKLFAGFIETSEKCKQELADEVRYLGGDPLTGTTILGNFFRIWLDVKLAFTRDDRKVIFDSCEYGEDVTEKAYKKAFSNEHEALNTKQIALLKAQLALIKVDHSVIQNMRDKLMTNNG